MTYPTFTAENRQQMSNYIIELEEKVDFRKVNFLSKLQNYTGDAKKDRMIAQLLRSYMRGFQKERSFLIQYRPNKETNGLGRLVSYNTFQHGKYTGLSTFKKLVRSYLAEDNYVDVDIVKAHWHILRYLLSDKNMNYDLVDRVLERYQAMSKDECEKWKGVMFSVLYSDPERLQQNQMFEQVQEQFPELYELHQILYTTLITLLKSDFPSLYKKLSKKKTNGNVNGSFLSIVCQEYEKRIILMVVDEFQKRGWNIGSIIHDGLLVEKQEQMQQFEQVLDEICEQVNEEYEDANIQLVVKPFIEHPWTKVELSDYEDVNGSNFFVLCNKLLKYAKENNLKHDEEFVYIQSMDHPFVYECMWNIPEFIEFIFEDDELFNQSMDNFRQMEAFVSKRDMKGFRKLEYDMEWFAFENGALNIETMEFFPMNALPQKDIVARKYIAQKLDPNNLNTKLFDELIDFQCQDPVVSEWLYIFIARLLFPPSHDKLDVIPYIYGERSTGKSTLRNIVAQFFPPESIATLNSTYEKKFGLFNIINKQVLLASDLPENLADTIQLDVLKAMACGEQLSIAVKYQQARMEECKTPALFISNFLPNYRDTNGAVSKRFAIFIWRNYVERQDAYMEQRIIDQELSSILYKALYLYHKNRHLFSCTFEQLRPKYFQQTCDEYIESVENMYTFLMQPDSKDGEYRNVFDDDMITPLSDIIRRYKKWCEFQKIKPDWVMGDYTVFRRCGLKVYRERICRSCRQSTHENCCEHYNPKNTMNELLVKGFGFINPYNKN